MPSNVSRSDEQARAFFIFIRSRFRLHTIFELVFAGAKSSERSRQRDCLDDGNTLDRTEYLTVSTSSCVLPTL